MVVEPENIPLGLAFVVGLISFASPCVLALVPAYLGYLSSQAVTAGGQGVAPRWSTFTHGVAFVLGFSLIFVAGGATAGAVGLLLFDAKEWLVKIGGVALVIMGLHTLGLIRIPFLDYDTRPAQMPDRRWGYLSSALMGVFFSAGWTPCIGPVLSGLFTLAAEAANVWRGIALFSAYSLGLGIPFLLVAAGLGNVSQWLKRYGKYLRYVSWVTGGVVILLGVLLFTDSFALFARWLGGIDFQVDLERRVIDFWRGLTGQP